MDGIVRTDTVQMTKVLNENKVRARLEQKFIEYSVPAIINSNATYFAGFFYFALIGLLVLESTRLCIKPASRFGAISRSIATLLISWSLPSAFFYSALSTLFYSFTEPYSGWRKGYYYSMGFLTFLITVGCIVVLALTGQIWGFHPTEEQEGESSQKIKHHNIYQKLSIIGIREEFLTPTKKGTIAITINQTSMLRYTLMMLLVIILQEQKIAMLALLLVIQLIFVGAAVSFGLIVEQFDSVITSVIYLIFEGFFTALITGLLLLSSFTREPNSDNSYSRGTVPLITVILLVILLKFVHLVLAAALEYKKSTKKPKFKGFEKSKNGGNQELFTQGPNMESGAGQQITPNEKEDDGLPTSVRSKLNSSRKDANSKKK